MGRIRNIFNGCINEYCSKADKFLVDFPAGCSFDDKCLILMSAIVIDYDNFEYTFCNLPWIIMIELFHSTLEHQLQ